MQQYNMLQAIFMSFYSQSLYRDVAKNWGGKVFLYLFLILALSWIGPTILMQLGLNAGYSTFSAKMVPQIPVLTIKDGQIHTPEAKAYIITEPDSDKKIAMIDTTGAHTTLEQAQVPLLITDHSVISQSNETETKTYTISKNINMVIDPKTVDHYLRSYASYAWIFFFFIAWFLSYIYRLIQAVLYALFGKLFCAIQRVNLSYLSVYRLALVAITPVIVLATVLDVLQITFHFQLLLYFIVGMAYLYYAILSNKHSNT